MNAVKANMKKAKPRDSPMANTLTKENSHMGGRGRTWRRRWRSARVNAVELQVHMVVVCDRMSDDRDLVEDVVEDLVGD
jgi:hypothetical protein